MNKVLITGGSGLLGKYLLDTAPKSTHVMLTYLSNVITECDCVRLDITDNMEVAAIITSLEPDTVIHCAAIGSVDYCENNEQDAYGVNVIGTENVVRAAHTVGARFVYISSNAVFGGGIPPYDSHSIRLPANVYGKMKMHAEDIVMSYQDWLIVRPIMLYGWPYPGGRGNWATRVIEFLRANMPLKVVDDTVTQPTYAYDCAKIIWKLLKLNTMDKIYNVGSMDTMSLYDYTRKVASTFDLYSHLLEPVGSDYFEDLAPRPVDTTYSFGDAIAAGALEDGLQRMKLEMSGEGIVWSCSD